MLAPGAHYLLSGLRERIPGSHSAPRRMEGGVNASGLVELHRTMREAQRNYDRNAASPAARGEYIEARARWHAEKLAARARFAGARGWITARTAFSLEQLAQTRAGRYFARDFRGEALDRRAFDHAEFFRWPARPFRPAGIVVHVYADDYTLCEQLAARSGLTFEPLPISWYYPGGTGAGVYTRADSIARCA